MLETIMQNPKYTLVTAALALSVFGIAINLWRKFCAPVKRNILVILDRTGYHGKWLDMNGFLYGDNPIGHDFHNLKEVPWGEVECIQQHHSDTFFRYSCPTSVYCKDTKTNQIFVSVNTIIAVSNTLGVNCLHNWEQDVLHQEFNGKKIGSTPSSQYVLSHDRKPIGSSIKGYTYHNND